MYFGLTDEQQELATTVRALLAKRADSTAVRASMAADAGYDEGLWQTLCEQIGATALAIPEDRGGAGFSLFESVVVLEELGRSLAPSPMLAGLVAAEAIGAAGDASAADRLLPRVAAGEIATLGNVLPDGRTGEGLAANAGADGAWALSGTVDRVLFGSQAAILLIATETPEGVALFELDAGVERVATPAMDPGTPLARLQLTNVPAVRLAGEADAGLARARQVTRVCVAALQVGVAQRGLDMTVAYSRERVQFGRPIGSFQALKHRMADMLVAVETARSAAWAAAYAVATAASDADVLAAVAASHCTEALDHVAGETIQLHGGIAITWEHDAHLVFKRAHALHQLVGNPHAVRASLIS